MLEFRLCHLIFRLFLLIYVCSRRQSNPTVAATTKCQSHILWLHTSNAKCSVAPNFQSLLSACENPVSYDVSCDLDADQVTILLDVIVMAEIKVKDLDSANATIRYDGSKLTHISASSSQKYTNLEFCVGGEQEFCNTFSLYIRFPESQVLKLDSLDILGQLPPVRTPRFDPSYSTYTISAYANVPLQCVARANPLQNILVGIANKTQYDGFLDSISVYDFTPTHENNKQTFEVYTRTADGSVSRKYQVIVNVLPSIESRLKSIAVTAGGQLSPQFSPDKYSYFVIGSPNRASYVFHFEAMDHHKTTCTAQLDQAGTPGANRYTIQGSRNIVFRASDLAYSPMPTILVMCKAENRAYTSLYTLTFVTQLYGTTLFENLNVLGASIVTPEMSPAGNTVHTAVLDPGMEGWFSFQLKLKSPTARLTISNYDPVHQKEHTLNVEDTSTLWHHLNPGAECTYYIHVFSSETFMTEEYSVKVSRPSTISKSSMTGFAHFVGSFFTLASLSSPSNFLRNLQMLQFLSLTSRIPSSLSGYVAYSQAFDKYNLGFGEILDVSYVRLPKDKNRENLPEPAMQRNLGGSSSEKPESGWMASLLNWAPRENTSQASEEMLEPPLTEDLNILTHVAAVKSVAKQQQYFIQSIASLYLISLSLLIISAVYLICLVATVALNEILSGNSILLALKHPALWLDKLQRAKCMPRFVHPSRFWLIVFDALYLPYTAATVGVLLGLRLQYTHGMGDPQSASLQALMTAYPMMPTFKLYQLNCLAFVSFICFVVLYLVKLTCLISSVEPLLVFSSALGRYFKKNIYVAKAMVNVWDLHPSLDWLQFLPFSSFFFTLDIDEVAPIYAATYETKQQADGLLDGDEEGADFDSVSSSIVGLQQIAPKLHKEKVYFFDTHIVELTPLEDDQENDALIPKLQSLNIHSSEETSLLLPLNPAAVKGHSGKLALPKTTLTYDPVEQAFKVSLGTFQASYIYDSYNLHLYNHFPNAILGYRTMHIVNPYQYGMVCRVKLQAKHLSSLWQIGELPHHYQFWIPKELCQTHELEGWELLHDSAPKNCPYEFVIQRSSALAFVICLTVSAYVFPPCAWLLPWIPAALMGYSAPAVMSTLHSKWKQTLLQKSLEEQKGQICQNILQNREDVWPYTNQLTMRRRLDEIQKQREHAFVLGEGGFLARLRASQSHRAFVRDNRWLYYASELVSSTAGSECFKCLICLVLVLGGKRLFTMPSQVPFPAKDTVLSLFLIGLSIVTLVLINLNSSLIVLSSAYRFFTQRLVRSFCHLVHFAYDVTFNSRYCARYCRRTFLTIFHCLLDFKQLARLHATLLMKLKNFKPYETLLRMQSGLNDPDDYKHRTRQFEIQELHMIQDEVGMHFKGAIQPDTLTQHKLKISGSLNVERYTQLHQTVYFQGSIGGYRPNLRSTFPIRLPFRDFYLGKYNDLGPKSVCATIHIVNHGFRMKMSEQALSIDSVSKHQVFSDEDDSYLTLYKNPAFFPPWGKVRLNRFKQHGYVCSYAARSRVLTIRGPEIKANRTYHVQTKFIQSPQTGRERQLAGRPASSGDEAGLIVAAPDPLTGTSAVPIASLSDDNPASFSVFSMIAKKIKPPTPPSPDSMSAPNPSRMDSIETCVILRATCFTSGLLAVPIPPEKPLPSMHYDVEFELEMPGDISRCFLGDHSNPQRSSTFQVSKHDSARVSETPHYFAVHPEELKVVFDHINREVVFRHRWFKSQPGKNRYFVRYVPQKTPKPIDAISTCQQAGILMVSLPGTSHPPDLVTPIVLTCVTDQSSRQTSTPVLSGRSQTIVVDPTDTDAHRISLPSGALKDGNDLLLAKLIGKCKLFVKNVVGDVFLNDTTELYLPCTIVQCVHPGLALYRVEPNFQELLRVLRAQVHFHVGQRDEVVYALEPAQIPWKLVISQARVEQFWRDHKVDASISDGVWLDPLVHTTHPEIARQLGNVNAALPQFRSLVETALQKKVHKLKLMITQITIWNDAYQDSELYKTLIQRDELEMSLASTEALTRCEAALKNLKLKYADSLPNFIYPYVVEEVDISLVPDIASQLCEWSNQLYNWLKAEEDALDVTIDDFASQPRPQYRSLDPIPSPLVLHSSDTLRLGKSPAIEMAFLKTGVRSSLEQSGLGEASKETEKEDRKPEKLPQQSVLKAKEEHHGYGLRTGVRLSPSDEEVGEPRQTTTTQAKEEKQRRGMEPEGQPLGADLKSAVSPSPTSPEAAKQQSVSSDVVSSSSSELVSASQTLKPAETTKAAASKGKTAVQNEKGELAASKCEAGFVQGAMKNQKMTSEKKPLAKEVQSANAGIQKNKTQSTSVAKSNENTLPPQPQPKSQPLQSEEQIKAQAAKTAISPRQQPSTTAPAVSSSADTQPLSDVPPFDTSKVDSSAQPPDEAVLEDSEVYFGSASFCGEASIDTEEPQNTMTRCHIVDQAVGAAMIDSFDSGHMKYEEELDSLDANYNAIGLPTTRQHMENNKVFALRTRVMDILRILQHHINQQEAWEDGVLSRSLVHLVIDSINIRSPYMNWRPDSFGAHLALVRVWHPNACGLPDFNREPVWIPCFLKLSSTAMKILLPARDDVAIHFSSPYYWTHVLGFSVQLDCFEQFDLSLESTPPKGHTSNMLVSQMPAQLACRLTSSLPHVNDSQICMVDTGSPGNQIFMREIDSSVGFTPQSDTFGIANSSFGVPMSTVDPTSPMRSSPKQRTRDFGKFTTSPHQTSPGVAAKRRAHQTGSAAYQENGATPISHPLDAEQVEYYLLSLGARVVVEEARNYPSSELRVAHNHAQVYPLTFRFPARFAAKWQKVIHDYQLDSPPLEVDHSFGLPRDDTGLADSVAPSGLPLDSVKSSGWHTTTSSPTLARSPLAPDYLSKTQTLIVAIESLPVEEFVIHYTGRFDNHRYQGKGVLKWSESEIIYSGDWNLGKRTGSGQCSIRNSRGIKWTYDGHFDEDRIHGEGVYSLSDMDMIKRLTEASKIAGTNAESDSFLKSTIVQYRGRFVSPRVSRRYTGSQNSSSDTFVFEPSWISHIFSISPALQPSLSSSSKEASPNSKIDNDDDDASSEAIKQVTVDLRPLLIHSLARANKDSGSVNLVLNGTHPFEVPQSVFDLIRCLQREYLPHLFRWNVGPDTDANCVDTLDSKAFAVYADGSRYYGALQKGVPSGKGIFCSGDESVICDATFADGKPNGAGIFIEQTITEDNSRSPPHPSVEAQLSPRSEKLKELFAPAAKSLKVQNITGMFVGSFIHGLRSGSGIQTYNANTVFLEGVWENDVLLAEQALLVAEITPPSPQKIAPGSTIQEIKSKIESPREVVVNDNPESASIKMIRYVGPSSNFLPSGYGKLWWNDHIAYQGEFYQGKRHGFGVLVNTETNQVLIAGTWFNDVPHHNVLRLALPNDYSYTGEINHGVRQGAGQLWRVGRDDPIYDGMWESDFPHGRGTLIAADGIYEGEFNKGMRSGKGTFTYTKHPTPTGKRRIYSGDWVDDLPHGVGMYTDDLGQTRTYRFERGRLVLSDKQRKNSNKLSKKGQPNRIDSTVQSSTIRILQFDHLFGSRRLVSKNVFMDVFFSHYKKSLWPRCSTTFTKQQLPVRFSIPTGPLEPPPSLFLHKLSSRSHYEKELSADLSRLKRSSANEIEALVSQLVMQENLLRVKILSTTGLNRVASRLAGATALGKVFACVRLGHDIHLTSGIALDAASSEMKWQVEPLSFKPLQDYDMEIELFLDQGPSKHACLGKVTYNIEAFVKTKKAKDVVTVGTDTGAKIDLELSQIAIPVCSFRRERRSATTSSSTSSTVFIHLTLHSLELTGSSAFAELASVYVVASCGRRKVTSKVFTVAKSAVELNNERLILTFDTQIDSPMFQLEIFGKTKTGQENLIANMPIELRTCQNEACKLVHPVDPKAASPGRLILSQEFINE